jgi:antitoxin (DNA-binding transcriptional repressor) of toxin-antitoxin stability system
MSDMKTLTMRDLNRNTARVLDALEGGETFEVRRRGKAVGYLTTTSPTPPQKTDWKEHFEWLRKQKPGSGKALLQEFEESRRQRRLKDAALDRSK